IELLPAAVRFELEFTDLFANLQQIHFPTPECYSQMLNDGFHPAQRRLAYEELLAHHLSLRKKRQQQQKEVAYCVEHADQLAAKLIATLPFQLTNAQTKAIAIIRADMRQNFPMLRLMQGDVGSGKTLVAIMAALAAIESGLQVAFMVPTEILAEQHYANVQKWFATLGIQVACLVSKLTTKDKTRIKQELLAGNIHLVIGTHALFQEDVQFNKLGLVIIDEQHKFGVAQRLALQRKGVQQQYMPHQLILTATPIPRTLAMTFYADLDYAVIDELPPGRKPITTLVVSDKRRAEVLERVVSICAQGQQVYWVCTLIAESEAIDSTPAELAYQNLQQQLPQLRVALIHAKLPSEKKEQIMYQFKNGAIDLLVATTVIEVGVDVPNACLMVIENPERLGLAQLHQLRGRVGRGALQSYCLLLYKTPLGQKAMQRLQFMRDSQDGFAIAEFDLKLRGPGEVFGTRQSGLANLRIADLVRDKDLLPKVATMAEIILQDYPEIVPLLLQRWIRQQLAYAAV
ncbi:MAG TPA: ATP-dependent DNA helicase RecG, partial [Gammaproteobacteria bacterium]|nr:ATP-dependent DNA helicase RecG [Gammaproteobacteria bacterium]